MSNKISDSISVGRIERGSGPAPKIQGWSNAGSVSNNNETIYYEMRVFRTDKGRIVKEYRAYRDDGEEIPSRSYAILW